MDETDAFFTRTVVGPPVRAVLGQRQAPAQGRAGGLEVSLARSEQRLGEAWRAWAAPPAFPDEGAGPLPPPAPRRWLERHALAVALVGLASFALGVVMMTMAAIR
jgi:hypothetical protein